MVVKVTRNYSATDDKSVELDNSRVIGAGIYNNIKPNDMLIFCDTSDGDIVISGFESALKGLTITFIKTSPNNSLRILHESSNSAKNIKNSSMRDITLFPQRYGELRITSDGESWYCGEYENTSTMNSAAIEIPISTDNVLIDVMSCDFFRTVMWTVSIYSDDNDMRSSSMLAVHNTQAITYTEHATDDIGDTSSLTLRVELVDGVIKLMADNANETKKFYVKTLRTLI